MTGDQRLELLVARHVGRELQQETFFEKKPFKYLNNILKDVGIGIDSRRPSNPEISDPAFGHIPAVKNSVDMIKKGHPPLWNPYTACGLPQMAAGNFSPFYPLNLLFLLPGINVIWAETIKILLQFLLFSVGIFYLCRLINLSGFASLVVTVAFCFSTGVINWISFSSLDSLFLFPFILIFIEKFLVTKKYKYLFYEAIAVSTLLLSSSPKFITYILQLAVIFLAIRLIKYKIGPMDYVKKLCAFLAIFILLLVLAVGIGSIQLLPMIESIKNSARSSTLLNTFLNPLLFTENTISAFKDPVSGIFAKWRLQPLLSFIIPKLFGLGSDLKIWSALPYTEFCNYIGLFSFLAMITGIAFGKKREVWLLFIAGVICFCIYSVIPGITQLYMFVTPGAGAGMIRLNPFFCFLFVLSAGYYLDTLYGSARKESFISLYRTCIVALLLIAFALCTFYIFRTKIFNAVSSTDFFGIVNFYRIPQETEVTRLGFSEHQFIKYTVKNLLVAILILASASFVLKQLVKGRISFKYSKKLLIAIIFFDLFLYGSNFNPVVKPSNAYQPTEIIKFLQNQEGLFRISRFGTNNFLPSGASNYFYLYDSQGRAISLTNQRIHDFINLIESERAFKFLIFPFKDPKSFQKPIFNLLNAKYILSSNPVPFSKDASGKFPLLMFKEGIYIYENKNFLPRAFLVYETDVLSDDNDVKKEISSLDFNPAQKAIISNGKTIKSSFTPNDKIEIVNYQENSVDLSVLNQKECYLIFLDSHYPGWQVYVDNKEEKIERAYYAFRAVYLKPGQHDIKFIYNPKSYLLGKIFFVVSLAVLAILGFLLFKKSFMPNWLKANK